MPSNNLVDKIHITNEEAQAGYDEYNIGASASNVSATFRGESTDVQSSLSDLGSIPELSPDETDFDYNDNTGDLFLTTPVFKGTLTEWNALTSAEKAHYENGIVNINDNNEYVSADVVVDTVASGNMHAVTSNAAFGLINLLYPVGSIYMSVNDVNPGTYLTGTTWEAWGSGRVPVGVDTNDTSFDTAEETGGTKSSSYTPSGSVSKPTFSGTAASLSHSGGAVSDTALTVAQLPSHNHGMGNYVVNANISQYANINVGSGSSVIATAPSNYTTGSTGSGTKHGHGFTQPTAHSYTPAGSVSQPSFTGSAASIDVVQPYITCYMWKRTA